MQPASPPRHYLPGKRAGLRYDGGMLRRALSPAFASILLGGSLLHCGGEDFQSGDGDTTGSGTGASSGTGPGSGSGASECAGPAADCAPEPPSDWKGPAKVVVAPSLPEGICTKLFEQVVRVNVPPLHAPHECNACSCGDPSGVTCSVPSVTVYSSASCNTTPSNKPPDPGGGCSPLGGFGAEISGSNPSGGVCQASGGEPAGAPSWAARAAICERPIEPVACAGGVCIPELDAAFDTATCVWREGEEPSCPEPYADRRVYFQDLSDERTCSSCACGQPTGASCVNAVSGFVDGECQSPGYVIVGDGSCQATEGHNIGMIFDAEAATGGACTPSGGEPDGDAIPTGPLTVCCLP